MYLSFYKLKAKPFQISADPEFLWLGEKHKEAFATLKYGIMDSKGFLLLTGDVGTGKTTLINALVSSLGDNITVATIPDPDLEKLDFFNFIANAFKIKKNFDSKGSFLVYFDRFLHTAFKKNKKVLLIIDEAQRLNHKLLEEIRLLSNIERQDTKLINIFFVGQNEFNDILLENRNRALRQRITLNYNIDPLTESETEEYIRHRLKVAGSERKIFSSDAMREIFYFSKGYPRLINILCDHALLTGYVVEKNKIKSAIIKECAKELRIPAQTGKSTDIKQETPKEVKPEIVEKTQPKPWRKAVGYIVLLTLLLIIAGHQYSPVGYDQYFINIKQFFSQYIRSAVDLKPENSSPTLKVLQGDAVGGDSIQSDDNNIREGGLASQGYSVLKEKETPNSGLSLKRNKDLSILEKEETGKSLDERRNEQNTAENAIKIQRLLEQKFVIYFNYNSNELAEDVYETLDQLAEAIIQNSDISIVITGYTDNSGRFIYNKKLSEFRANIVKSYFMGKGVSPLQIKAIGKGPVISNEIKDLKERIGSSRRVEIELELN